MMSFNFQDVANLAVDAVKEEKVEETESEKRNKKVKQHFDDMIENTSFHGINYIVDEKYPIRRLIWFIITFTAFVYSLLKVYESTVEYMEYPFATAVMRKYVDGLQFPAVSFCNQNDMRLSVMNNTQLDRAIKSMNMRLLENVTAEEMEELSELSKHKLEDMLVECVFDGQACSHKNFTKFAWSQGDRCFMFNSGKKGHRKLSVTGGGLKRSLMLTINIEHYDYYRDLATAGIHLMIHGQDHTPVRIQGPIIPPGFATYVQIDKIFLKNLKPPFKTRCGSLQLKHHKAYSYDACWLEQLTDYVVKNCSCRQDFMPGETVPICKGSQYFCLWDKWEEFEAKKLYSCPPPCELDMFHYSIASMSRTLFPSEYYANVLKTRMEKKFPFIKAPLSKEKNVKRFMRDNLVRLIIYYDDMSYQSKEQKPSYDLTFFLGDIGGQIGLFVGAGAMSYFEIIDCFGMMFHSKFIESVK